MNNNDVNFTISATDKTKATFDAVEKRFGSLSNKAAESTSKLSGVASWAGYASGIEGVGKAAQAASGALGLMSGSMGLLGGPAGLALAAAAGVYAFVSSTDKSAESIAEMAHQTNEAQQRVAELAGNMVRVQQLKFQDEIDSSTIKLEELTHTYDGFFDVLRASGGEIEENSRQIIAQREKIAALKSKLEEYNQMALRGIMDPNHDANAAKAQEALNKRIEQERQAAAKIAETQNKANEAKFYQLSKSLLSEEQIIYASYYERMAIIEEAENKRFGTQELRDQARINAESDLQNKLAAIDESMGKQRAAIAAKYDAWVVEGYSPMQRLEEQYNNEFAMLSEHHEKMRTSEEQYQRDIEDLQERYRRRKEALDKQATVTEREMQLRITSDLSVLMMSKNKAQFEFGKRAAIANATIATIEAAQLAFKDGMKINGIYAYAAAAAAMAAGVARVNAIRSTHFDSGSTGVSAGSGGVSAGAGFNGGSPAGAPQLPTTQQTQQQGITIQILGDNYGWDQYMQEKIITGIREAVGRDVALT